jgi:outer membrane protein assembly factor BamB
MLRLFALSLTFLIAGCHSLQIQDARRTADSDWLTEGFSPQRGHAVQMELDPPLKTVWTYNAGAGFGPASPLIVGDVVLVANRKGEVHAIDLRTGKKAGQNQFGDAIEGTPVVHDGVMFVPVGWGGRALQAYDLVRGQMRWRIRSTPIDAGLLLSGSRVISADTRGAIRAYSIEDGVQEWEYQMAERVSIKASPVQAGDGRIVVADDAGNVAALRAESGSAEWTTTLEAPVYVSPAASDETVYLATTRGRLVALDAASGEVRWKYELTDTTVRLSPPAFDYDLVVFGTSDGNVHALDAATGDALWMTAVDGAVTAPPLITLNTIYAGTMRNRLVGLDRSTGSVRWTGEVEGRIKSAFAAKDGRLIVLSEPRIVYLFELTEDENHVAP